MTKKEASLFLKDLVDVIDYQESENDDFLNARQALKMAIKALEQEPKWIPVSWHKITEEERAENGYPEDWDMLMDCEMPTDNEEILVTTRYGTVEQDLSYYEDGIYYLDSGYDWILDVVAWMSSPEPYNESEGQNANRNQIGMEQENRK